MRTSLTPGNAVNSGALIWSPPLAIRFMLHSIPDAVARFDDGLHGGWTVGSGRPCRSNFARDGWRQRPCLLCERDGIIMPKALHSAFIAD